MAEYIEREALIKRLEATPILKYGIPTYVRDGVIDLVAKQPAADVDPVKRGKWEDVAWNIHWQTMIATCSHCKVRGEIRYKHDARNDLVPNSPRCPNCGAKMKG